MDVRIFKFAAAVLLTFGAAPAALAEERQLDGLTKEQANSVITTLEAAQDDLRTGEFQNFTLLAGSVASYEQAELSPRDVFLSVPFKSVWKIRRVDGETVAWRRYRLSYAPEGLGKRYWDIEVTVRSNDELEQVTMTYRVPAPF